MPRRIDPKCLACAQLDAEAAIALHGPKGDDCWDSKRCPRRRSHYRNRRENNAKRRAERIVAQGKPVEKCGIRDEHIRGLAHVPALVAAGGDRPLGKLRAMVKEHVGATHAHPNVLRAADTLVRVCGAVRELAKTDHACV